MKLGVSVYSFSSYKKKTGASYEEICRLAKEMGFDGIDFTDIIKSFCKLVFADNCIVGIVTYRNIQIKAVYTGQRKECFLIGKRSRCLRNVERRGVPCARHRFSPFVMADSSVYSEKRSASTPYSAVGAWECRH